LIEFTISKTSPESFIHIFVSNPEKLREFLEAINERGQGTKPTTNTLLELYLRDDQITGLSKEERRKKAMKLLETSDYDEAHALVLSKMHDFKEGRLFIYDKQMLYNEIVQFYMDNDDYENVIASCKKIQQK